MKTSRWPISHLPISGVTPFTYRDGETYLSMLNRLAQYVTEQLHPSLRETVEHMVEELEHILAAQHGKYVEGIQDFQRIHDAFMTDVNSALMALNDNAVTDLARDPGSAFGSYLHNRHRMLEQQHDDTLNYVSHTKYGVEADDLDSLRSAISRVSVNEILTIPKDMVFHVPEDDPLVIDRPLHMSGGHFKGVGRRIVQVTSSDVTLEYVTVTGNDDGSLPPMIPGQRALVFEGEETRRIRNVRAKHCRVANVGYWALGVVSVDGFTMENCVVTNYRYGGITAGNARNGVIRNNHVSNAISDSSVNHNCYGIYTSNPASAPLENRCRNIDILHNTVENIPHWEGIDTHNGQQHLIMGNTIRGCRRGIAMVANMDVPDSGPSDIRVIGNFVDGQGKSLDVHPNDSGISMAGSGGRKGDAVITGNVITGFDNPILFNNDAPNTYRWTKCVVEGNSVDEHNTDVPSTNFISRKYRITKHFSVGASVSDIDNLYDQWSITDHRFYLKVWGRFTKSQHSSVLFRMEEYATERHFPDFEGEILIGTMTHDGTMYPVFLRDTRQVVHGGTVEEGECLIEFSIIGNIPEY